MTSVSGLAPGLPEGGAHLDAPQGLRQDGWIRHTWSMVARSGLAVQDDRCRYLEPKRLIYQ